MIKTDLKHIRFLVYSLLLILFSISSCHKPIHTPENEFKVFWDITIEELASFPLISEKIKSKVFNTKKISLYRINSYNDIHFYIWLSEPISNGIYKSKLRFSSFGINNANWDIFPNDTFMMEENTLNLKIDIRGHGLSTEQIPFENYLSNGNTAKESYVYRGAYMDAVRAVDFIANHPKSNGKILTMGGSQGGLLSIVASALNKKVDVCIANFSFLADVAAYDEKAWAMTEITKGISYEEALKLFDYYDAIHFAKLIDIPFFTHCATDDNITPLVGIQRVYDNVNTLEKEMYIVDCQGHGCSSQSSLAIQKEHAFVEKYFNQ